jgi:hypothetical protein
MSLLAALALTCALFQAAPTSTIVLSGRVLEVSTGLPVAGAHVMAIPFQPSPSMQSPPTSTTDRNGRYHFDTLQSGHYRITVHKAGFALLDRSQPEIDVKEGVRLADVDVLLQKGAVIAGRVVDENGEPVVSASVTLLQHPRGRPDAPPLRGRGLFPVGTGAQTNDLGEFRLFSLAPGEYFVAAVADNPFGGSPVQRDTAAQPTYFPGAADRGAAQPIVVAAGQTISDVVIRLVTAPVFRVAGSAVGEDGQPVANAMVRLDAEQSGERFAFMGVRGHDARTDASGRFAINNVTSGTYTLVVTPGRVISAPSASRGRRTPGRSMAFGSTIVSGMVSGNVVTETSADGTTTEYRDDAATRVPVTVADADVRDLEIIVRRQHP